MREFAPLQIWELTGIVVAWSNYVYDGMSDDELMAQFLEDTSAYPESRRRQINLMFDFLRDESLSIEDKEDLIVDTVNRSFHESGDAVAWLWAKVDEVLAVRQVERTTTTDGDRPSLLETQRVRLALRDLKPEVGALPEPSVAAGVLRSRLMEADSVAGCLLQLMNSDYSDRAKADLVVETVGPFFYSDLEAIEWAAEVARAVEKRPRPVDEE